MSPPRRLGLTLIELIIIVVILGILITVAVSRLGRKQDNDPDALLRQKLVLSEELTRVGEAQKTYRAAHQRYALDVEALSLTIAPKVLIRIQGTGLESGTGWGATARRTDVEDLTCYLGVGVDTVIAGVVVIPHEVTCKTVSR